MGELSDVDAYRVDLKAAAELLHGQWAALQNAMVPVSAEIPTEIADAIGRSIGSKTKTYRYVLPTQLLAKAVNPSVDCRALQATAPIPGAFDARSVCQRIIVPFDQAAEGVLGRSPEPYANNPVRMPAILASERSTQKDRAGFDDLLTVLDFAQNHPQLAGDLLRAVLRAILNRLATVRVVYPVPNRVSQSAAVGAVETFIRERTGGVRLQAVAVALFGSIGRLYGQYRDVRSANVNAADASTGSVADLECVGANDTIVKAVEVKDRQLALLHVQSKLPALRERGITEAIFVVQGGTVHADAGLLAELIQKEFGSGQNIYVAEFVPFMENHLIIFGEDGRRSFLQNIGNALDEQNADVSHRQRWRDLLAAM